MFDINDEDIKNILEDSYGTRLAFHPSGWAPGIWAGTEGVVIKYKGIRYKIIQAMLHDRQLLVETLGIESGAV